MRLAALLAGLAVTVATGLAGCGAPDLEISAPQPESQAQNEQQSTQRTEPPTKPRPGQLNANLTDYPSCNAGLPAGAACHGWSVATLADEADTKELSWTCSFNVPQIPTALAGATHYLYCNEFGDSNLDASQFVPQLMIGDVYPCPDPVSDARNNWYIQAQYFYADTNGQPQCKGGGAVKVQPGDQITSEIKYDKASGSYILSIASTQTGGSSTLTVPNPRMDPSKSWANVDKQYVTAAWESWYATQANQYPADAWKISSSFSPAKPQGGLSPNWQFQSTMTSIWCATDGDSCTWESPVR